tara:strand:- start:2567 stop:3487 length:921 start_codon:yes stop_codon:yes gene_type:complete
MNNKITIGTRGSKLSLAYTNKVKSLILKKGLIEDKNINIKIIKTSGDLIQNKKISEIGGKSLFCKEIEDELVSGKIDVAVHSLKDMESLERKELEVLAYIERNDPRDSLISVKHKSLAEINSGIIGSGSKRRELQLKLINKNIKIKSIRGNIDTRIQKVVDGQYDAIILALAGLKMLSLEKYVIEIFPIENFLPSVGQGIIAAQCRKQDIKTKELLSKINHKETKICAITERAFLKAIGGDCETAVGGNATIEKDLIKLRVQLFSDDGKKVFDLEKKGSTNEPENLGKLVGEEILKSAGKNFKKKI